MCLDSDTDIHDELESIFSKMNPISKLARKNIKVEIFLYTICVDNMCSVFFFSIKFQYFREEVWNENHCSRDEARQVPVKKAVQPVIVKIAYQVRMMRLRNIVCCYFIYIIKKG